MAGPIIDRQLVKGWQVTAACRSGRCSTELEGLRRLSVVESAAEVRGTVDGVVTLTGSTADGRIEDLDHAQWSQVISDTLLSVALSLSVLKVRLSQGARVVVVGSVVGSSGARGAANYAAAKAGLLGLVRSAALEWGSIPVLVNLLELGYVDAGMGERLPDKVREKVLASIPLGRFATPDEVAEAVGWMLKTTYMTGSVVTLAGGLR